MTLRLNRKSFFVSLAIFSWCLSCISLFSNSKGYLTIAVIIISSFFTFGFSKINRKRLLFGYLFFLCWFAFVVLTKDVLFSAYFSISVVVMVVCLFFDAFLSKDTIVVEPSSKLIDIIMYYFLFYYYVRILVLYFKSGGDTTIFSDIGGTYVSFSVELFLLYCLGIKHHKYISSFILVVLGCFILPSRTFLFFILIHFLCIVFFKIIVFFCKKSCIDSCGKLMVIFFILSTILAYYIGIILPQRLSFYNGHGSANQLYDLSNVSRFRAHIYGIVALLKKFNLFTGIGESNAYFLIADIGVEVQHWPHNSYLQLLVFYSLSFGLFVLMYVSHILDKVNYGINITIIIPYLAIATIYHDLFTSYLFLFLSIISIDDRKQLIVDNHLLKYYNKGIN